jgi:hypothetical protein
VEAVLLNANNNNNNKRTASLSKETSYTFPLSAGLPLHSKGWPAVLNEAAENTGNCN